MTASPKVSKVPHWLTLLLLLVALLQMSAPWIRAESPKTGASYRVVHGWPVLPEGFVLGQVSGVAVDSHNHVFVFHRSYHSQKRTPEPIEVPAIMSFDGETGKLVASWGTNTFVLPHGLKVDRDDNVWATDLTLQQVLKFSHDGTLLMKLGTERVAGTDDKHFNLPTDIAFGPDGSIYVSDGYGNNRVVKFSSDGKYLLDWGRKGDKPGEFDLPHAVAADAEGRVYVADRSNSRLQIFDKEGKFLHAWKSAELGRPWGVTVGHDGYLYVIDGGDMLPRPPDRGRIMKLDLKGNILEKWSSFGNYDGQIYWGHDLAVGKDGAVYVGDVHVGMRVQKFVKTKKDFLYLPR